MRYVVFQAAALLIANSFFLYVWAQAGEIAPSPRPRYDGYNELDVEACTGNYKIQGLTELASRWGTKPFKKLQAGKFARGRVIFRDLRTGASIWRISDDPFAIERHRYADYSGWNCDGSFIGVIGALDERCRIISADASRDVTSRKGNRFLFSSSQAIVWDTRRPDVFYRYDGKNLLRVNFRKGEYKVILSAEKIKPLFAEFPKKPYIALWGVSDDGEWVMGRAGGSQDEGHIIFAAHTNGKEIRSARVPPDAGGIHSGTVMRDKAPIVILSLTYPRSQRLYNFATKTWENHRSIVPPPWALERKYTYSHRVIGPQRQIAFTHGIKPPGGYWGIVWLDAKTKKLTLLSRAKNWIEGHQTWCHADPDWLFASYQSKTAPGNDIFKIKTDGSRTAFRLCATGMKNPEFTVYDNNAFAASSPDGTKVQFMANMFGSVDEYFVVARSPGVPKKLNTVKEKGETVLRWSPPRFHKEIKGYLVYQGKESGQAKKLLTPELVTDTRFTLPNSAATQASCYVVTTVEHSGLESRYSNEVRVTPKEKAWQGDVRLYLEAEDGALTLPARPAFGPTVASDGHYVWQTKEGETGKIRLNVEIPRAGKYFFIGRVSGNVKLSPWQLVVDNGEKVPLQNPVVETAWEWHAWQRGKRPYGVKLAKGAHVIELSTEHRGAAIDALLVTTDPKWRPTRFGTADEMPPGRVSGLQATVDGTYAIALSWKSVQKDKDVHHYNIYASQGGKPPAKQKHLIASPATSPYLDWGLTPGTTYTYLITAVDRRGNESVASPVATAKTKPIVGGRVVFSAEAKELTVTAPATKENRDGKACVSLGGSGKGEVSFSFTAHREEEYVFWVEVMPKKKAIERTEVFLDDRLLGSWIVYYDQSALRGGRKKGGAWVSCPIVVRPYAKQGRFQVAAGKHKLTIRGGNLSISRITTTNDINFRPAGKINTLYWY